MKTISNPYNYKLRYRYAIIPKTFKRTVAPTLTKDEFTAKLECRNQSKALGIKFEIYKITE